MLSFSIVVFCSPSTFCKLSNSKVNLKSIKTWRSNSPFKQETLLIGDGFKLLLALTAVVFFTLNFVASTNSFQLCLFNLSRLRVKNINERSDHFVKAHNLLEEIKGFRLDVLGFAVLFSREHADLIVFVKGDIHVDLASVHLFKISNQLW